jgi:hypothetical protein
MSRRGDYWNDMRTERLLDREIERLLTGAPVEDRGLALLTPLVEGLRSSAGHRPQESEVRNVAARAAAVVLERSQHQVDTAASRRRRQWAGLSPRLAAGILAVLVVPAMTGAALAANSAIPGDPLYGLDRAFEIVGIGTGPTERLDEAAQLAAAGRSQQAIDHAVVALQSGNGDGTDEMAGQALATAAGRLSAAEIDQTGVAALLAYISENVGKGVGVDGRDFGQGVAELAREIGEGQGSDDPPMVVPGVGPDQPGSPATDPASPPAVTPGQGQGPPENPGNPNGGVGNGNGNDPSQTGSQNGSPGHSNTSPGHSNTSPGHSKADGDPVPPSADSAPPTADEATAEPTLIAPDGQGDETDDAIEAKNTDKGEKKESPSVTAPGRQGRP